MPGSSEGDRDRPQRAIIGSDRVAGGHGDGPSEGSREHDMAGLEMLSLRRELIGKPSDTHCGMPHDRRGNARLLDRSEEHTSELQSLMRISYAVFCLKKKNT